MFQRPLRLLVSFLGLAAAVLTVAACSGSAPAAGWTYAPPTAAAPASTPPAAAASPVAAMAVAPTPSPAGAAAMAALAMPAKNAPQMATPAPIAARTLVAAAPEAAQASFAVSLTIVTGDMIGKKDFPAYLPSDFSLPANSTVTITVTNFDDATPLPKGSEIYAQAAGIVDGTFTVTPINPADPNGTAGPTTTAGSLDPAQLSHTFTVPGLGINVPIAAHARVSFTIRTGAPGTYTWRCMDPCGSGSSGWMGPMAAKGYMEGTLTVVG